MELRRDVSLHVEEVTGGTTHKHLARLTFTSLASMLQGLFASGAASPIERRWWAVVALVLTIASLVPIWSVGYVPLQDYPYHLLRIHVISEFGNPVFGYERDFEVSLFPLPYVLMDYLVLLFSHIVDLQMAGKLVLSLYVVGFVASLFYFFRAFGESSTLLGFFSFVLVFNWHYYMGFVSFVLALPFFFATLGYYLRFRDSLNSFRLIVLSALITLTYLTHLYVFLYLGFALGSLALFSAARLRALGAIALCCLPPVILLAATARLHASKFLGSGSDGLVALSYPSLNKTIERAFGPKLDYFMAMMSWWEGRLVTALFVLCVVLIVIGVRRLSQRKEAVVLLGAFALLYLVLPEYVSPYYNYFSIRVLIIAAIFFAAIAPVPEVRIFRLALFGALTVTAIGSIAVSTRTVMQADSDLRNYGAILDEIPPHTEVCHLLDPQRMYWGSINPFALFHAYQYLDKPGGRPGGEVPEKKYSGEKYLTIRVGPIPRMIGFVGTLRTVYDRRIVDQPGADPQRIERIFARTEIDVGGMIVVLSGGAQPAVRESARRNGFQEAFSAGDVLILKRKSVPSTLEKKRYRTDFCDGVDWYVVIESLKDPALSANPEMVYVKSRGVAHLYRGRSGL